MKHAAKQNLSLIKRTPPLIKRTPLPALALCLCLCLCMSSCFFGFNGFKNPKPEPARPPATQPEDQPQNQAEQARFDEFLQRDFLNYVTSDTLTLHSNIQTPEDYGITGYEASWGDSLDAAPTEEDIAKDRKMIEEFRTFDRAALTRQQQESYDVYSWDAELYEKGLELYFYNTAFQGHNGLHYVIPIVMSEYRFFRARDVDDYLTLCSQIGMLFDAQIEFEKMKSEKGLFMADWMVDDVISGCEDFIAKKEDNIMILSFEERLDGIDFEDGADRAKYIARNKEIFNDMVVPAYEKVIRELTLLKGTGKNDMGLAHFERGKEYYIFELNNMGITRTPEELIAAFDKRIEELTAKMMEVLIGNSDLIDMLDNPISPDLPVEKKVDYLCEKGAEDFPALPQGVSFKVKVVDESLRDFAPGFYLLPPIDNFRENTIYYDPGQSDEQDYMFFLMAHEGFPGHMLQTTDLFANTLPDFRKLCYYKSYIEGWAHYVEHYSYKYSGADESLALVKQLDSKLSAAVTLRLDLGINYEGWTYEEMAGYMGNNALFNLPEDTLKSIYNDTIKTPMEIVPYTAGEYEIELMKEKYQSRLGRGYSDKLFHEEFLKRGGAPYFLIEEWMGTAAPGQSGPMRDSEQGARGTANLF